MIYIDSTGGIPVIVMKQKVLPVTPYDALTIAPVIFVREDKTDFPQWMENHERTHVAQQVEVMVIAMIITIVLATLGCSWWSFFAMPLWFYLYGIGYLTRRWYHRQDQSKAYKKSAFEAEAYAHQFDNSYNAHRKPFAWVKYLFK